MRKLSFILLLLFFGVSQAENSIVHLASTSSVRSSGLADALFPLFEKETGYTLKISAVGSGKALRLGRDGKVDLVWTHSPDAEKKFVADGHGIKITSILYNFFYIVGPDSDPASIHGMSDPVEAFRKIALSESTFISRADDSGTHRKELQFWRDAGINPFGLWYVELGQGMKMSLDYAINHSAYIMVDSGTYANSENKGNLVIHISDNLKLQNHYSITVVNPAIHENVNIEGATAFIEWISSARIRQMVNDFRVNGVQVYYAE